jgi:UDP-N-acetylmuramoyl-L-alanyl-D-glutamate--2,6-diaminopimelate ligase
LFLHELIEALGLPPEAVAGRPEGFPPGGAAPADVPARGAPGVRDPGPELAGATEDSREVGPGWLFCAFRGAVSDGRDFVPQAEGNGCAATICAPPDPGGARPRILVGEGRLRRVASEASRLVYGEPDRGLFKVGVTGTNGKTTVCALAEAVLRAAGRRPGVVGTTGFRFPGGAVREAPNTTPEGPLLWRTLREMADGGADALAMEVSSHALALGRLGPLTFDAAVFTNLSRDHLDFHGDMESYFRAKRRLFAGTPGGDGAAPAAGARALLVNADDAWGARLLEELGARARGFGFGAGEIRGEILRSSREGISLSVRSPEGGLEIRSGLLGRFNAENLLAAAALGLACGYPPELVGGALSGAAGAPGRLSRVGTDPEHLALVDYAHAPGALEAAVAAVRELGPARLIVVFGCGGDRDRGKRPLMGRAAAGGDVVILTSDNPRTEDPLAIMAEAEGGLAAAGLRKVPAGEAGTGEGRGFYVSEPDRAGAIALGAGLMRAGDILLVCGKGHEDYQIVGREKRRFDDFEVTLEALRSGGKSE